MVVFLALLWVHRTFLRRFGVQGVGWCIEVFVVTMVWCASQVRILLSLITEHVPVRLPRSSISEEGDMLCSSQHISLRSWNWEEENTRAHPICYVEVETWVDENQSFRDRDLIRWVLASHVPFNDLQDGSCR